MADKLITANSISVKRRGRVIFQDVSLSLERGEVVALIGANGVGKTTLFKVLAGVLPPDSGTLKRNCATEDIALLADKPALYPDWTVSETLHRIATMYQATVQKIETLAAQFGLNTILAQKVQDLSYGYRQRLAMVQVLLGEPEVILLDEPGNGLDYRQRRDLWPLLREMKKNSAVMLISHDLTEVATVSDRIYVLHLGKCYELNMPQRQPDWLWLEYKSEEQAKSAFSTPLARVGRFVAIASGTNYDSSRVRTVMDCFPPQALQERIDALD